jgi:general secretion pathway protein D
MLKNLCFGTLLVPILLAACAVEPVIPSPLDLPKKVADYSTLQQENEQNRELATRIAQTPKPPVSERLQTGKNAPALAPGASQEKADILLSFEQIPLPSFIQAVFAAILKKTITLDPKVVERKDLVTLRTGEPQTPSQVESATRLLLKSYGIAVVEMGGMVRVVPDNANLGYLPEIRRGRALPETPLPMRPIFQLVELQAVRNSDVAGWVRSMFGDKVKIQEDTVRNAVLLSGNSDDVMAVLEAIHVLDQPLMKGRQSVRISPQFWSADELAKRLSEILQTEGYAISTKVETSGAQPITLLPVAGANAVFAFSVSDKILEHIVAWAKELDKPNERGAGRNIFSYQVKYTDADLLAKTLQPLLTGFSVSSGAAPGATRPSQVVVDRGSNTLIFTGSSEDYGGILNLLKSLDKPAKEALIEVTVAEVSLNENSQLGIEWLAKEANLSQGRSYTASTLGGLSIGASGFNFRLLDNAGDLRLVINALASSNRATILSSPRVVARNGETAIIQVGQEVPIISSQQVVPTGTAGTPGTTGTVPQSIQYRSTGVILNVKPVIHSGDRVDLDVSQEVSAAQATTTGVSTSPTFSTRKVQTKLSLKNGATVLLGGLMSGNKSEGNAGIPLFKDIPVLGQLFRNDTGKNERTELIVLITPYIIENDNDAKTVTDAFRKRLGVWAQEPLPLPVKPATSDAEKNSTTDLSPPPTIALPINTEGGDSEPK